ncbi:MAG: hypothetical protein Q4G64_05090 [bacterium]|nr:hypothetical protein [bacterium]
MQDLISAVLGLSGIIALGWLFRRLGWAPLSSVGVISKILIYVTLPALIITSFNSTVIEPSLFLVTGFAMVAIVLQQLVAFHLLERRGGPREQVFALLNQGNYNVGNFAIPFLTTLMGPGAVVTAAMFDAGQGLLVIGLAYATATAIASGRPVTPLRVLGNALRNPVMIAYIGMVALRSLDITLPDPLIDFTSRVGAANTFLSLFMIGIGLQVRLPRASLTRAAHHLGVRYAFSLTLSLIVWFFLPLTHEVKVPLIMLLWAPIASLAPALTAETGGDFQLSSFVTALSTVVAMLAMPLVLVILT